MRWAGHAAYMRKMYTNHYYLVLRCDLKRQLARSKNREENNIKMCNKEIGCQGTN
jgi:hypothetical protein